MTNKEIQLDILNNKPELFTLYNDFKYTEYMYYKNYDDESIRAQLKERYFLLGNTLYSYPVEYIDNCRRLSKRKYKKVKRLKDDIKSMLDSNQLSYFLTMTFDDECLNTTTKETRRRYVTRFLKSISSKYNANIDYGKENHREHYHGCVLVDKLQDYSELQKIWKSISHQTFNVNTKVIYGSNSDGKLARYISKLTLHAFKTTTKNCHIIYSRES